MKQIAKLGLSFARMDLGLDVQLKFHLLKYVMVWMMTAMGMLMKIWNVFVRNRWWALFFPAMNLPLCAVKDIKLVNVLMKIANKYL